MLASIDGGPLHAKHQAPTVIHPIRRISDTYRQINEFRETDLVRGPRSEELQGQDWLTIDTARQRLDHCVTVRRLILSVSVEKLT